MGKEILVSHKADGKRLIDELMKSNSEFEITTAMWYYLDEPDAWRLMIASPYVQKNGPLKSYKLIRSAIDRINTKSRKKLSFSLENIAVLKPDDPLVNLLKSMVRHSRGITLINCYINGFLIEGAHIYFID